MMMHKALGPVLALCCAAACSQGEPAIDPGAGDDLTAIPAAPEVAGGCAHDVCDEGVALDATCSPCAAAVCQQDPECCATAWDQLCVFEAEDLCGEDCTSCSHGLCVEGEALDPICDPCVPTVCKVDPFCCDVEWDALCTQEGEDLCGCVECAHDPCETGEALDVTCDPCVRNVCDLDSFCCDVEWDDLCVDEANDICDLQCGSPDLPR